MPSAFGRALAIGDAPFLPGAVPAAALGQPCQHAFTITGNSASTVTVADGARSDGRTLSVDGVLSGTSATAGRFEFTVTATDSIGAAVLPVTLEVADTNPPEARSLGSLRRFGLLNRDS